MNRQTKQTGNGARATHLISPISDPCSDCLDRGNDMSGYQYHTSTVDGAAAEARGSARPKPSDFGPEDEDPRCPVCKTYLAKGARFCHKCDLTAEEWEDQQ